jgi:anti-sigma factor RsiW
MRPMQCESTRELMGAYLDQELYPDERRDVAAHLVMCARCTATADEIGRVSRQLAAIGRQRPQRELRSRVVAALVTVGTQAPLRTPKLLRAQRPGLMRHAAVLTFACALTAIATAMGFSRIERGTLLEREVVSAHVSSLLQDRPFQVASSNTHTVKPWFSRRIEFSPPVNDLASDGFQLLGGRIDYFGGRRVAAVVYRRYQHVVNVFLWPSTNTGELMPRHDTLNGYNLLVWKSGGMTYWAISDINAEELQQLHALLQ